MILLPPPLLLLVLVIGAFGASEAGYWLGRLTGPRDEAFDRQLGIVRGATFAVVAFLIGFTFSGAATRYVDRLDIIVKEANALGTAWLRADSLPEPARGKLKETLREYTAERVALLKEDDMSAILAGIARAPGFHERMWQTALKGAEANPTLALLVLPSVNEVIDLHAVHLSAARRHLPTAIFVALLVTVALSLGLAAFGHGQLKRRFMVLDLMYGVVLAAALWMTIDLDYPRYGFIRTNSAPLVETLAGMKP